MNRIIGIIAFILWLVSCSKVNDNHIQSMDFNPINVSAKWRYSYSNKFISSMNSRMESGYRDIVIESRVSYKYSIVYEALITDSTDSLRIQPPGGVPETIKPFSLTHKIHITEYLDGRMRIMYNQNNDGRRDDMLDYAFRRRTYPDSLIKVDTLFGEPRHSVTLYQAPSAIYFDDVGMESYYYSPCSGSQSCPINYKLMEYSLNQISYK